MLDITGCYHNISYDHTFKNSARLLRLVQTIILRGYQATCIDVTVDIIGEKIFAEATHLLVINH